MKKRTFFCLLVGMTVPVISSAEAIPKNEVPILIYWSTVREDAPPSGVTFDDQGQGAIPFARQNDHYRGVRTAQGNWAFHEVSLLYGGQEAPLALRTRAGVPGVRIDVALPSVRSCKPSQVASLRQVSENAPVRARLKTMLAARHLLELRSNVCPPWATRDLAEIYFVMSCSLAKKTNFFRVSEEAKERYIRFARNRNVAEKRIQACDNQMFGTAAANLREAAQESLSEGDFQRFAAINADLRASADKEGWKSGLAVQGLDENTLRVDLLKGLYTEQQLAGSKFEYGRALQVNAKLRDLLMDVQFKRAFAAVSLDGAKLKADREFLEAKFDPSLPQQ